MALKKSQLYSSLWSSCDELRGGMDASQYKDYVLTLLFMKYVSDKYGGKPDATIEVPEGGSFADMVKLKGDKEIGDKINKIIGVFAEANDLKNVIDQADFNDEDKLGRGKEMQDRLSKLVAIFDGLDFRTNRAEGDDLLGDAYEYLMRNFATESGKSKGQFYTPAEVSRIMANVIGIDRAGEFRDPTVYDPTCGSGSLLIKAADEANIKNIAIYGQEMDNATWALARMNMILHDYPAHEIWKDNTLSLPKFKNPDNSLQTFDFAIANPPFSSKAWTTGFDPANDEFHRFEYGVPPAKNGDYAFLLHLIKSLKSKGKGAIILPHGVLFRGHREANIRRNIVKRGLIKGIIGLPANLFYGTGIPACILVIDKEHAHARTGIFMIDASKGFMKDGNKNRLRSQDIHKIVEVFNKQIELPRYSRMIPVAEIADPANDYNLNIPRYIDSSEPEDLHDLHAHLNGGIPNRDVDALQPYWDVFPSLRNVLFRNNGTEGYSEPSIETQQVKPTILAHPEYKAFAGRVTTIFEQWREVHEPLLKGLDIGTKPKEAIHTISEDLLAHFTDIPLLNRYDAYQRLMDYWADAMQDDIYLIAVDGWIDAAKPRGIIEDKEKKIKETPDLTLGRIKYKMDLIPPNLIVARYFEGDQAEVDELRTKQESATQELEEFVEEHTGEEGLLADVTNDKGKVTKGAVKERLKQIGKDPEFADEHDALTRCMKLIVAESEATKAVKNAQAELNTRILAKYPKLSGIEIKALVVEDKWFASVQSAIIGEVQRVIQQLAGRVKELDDRYADPLPRLETDVNTLSTKVEDHLKKMGFEWI
ncbi:type I restriction endonuclease subunit M [candidate division LCP-89 bacterium B3_LCP]|uniref:site-specific DNA-methyltransferase (adenine-specific) n=1 Tax=candidate division LCP-89 bacterium B3_LCP TaxID=2012998 RepID=A0A532V237_UNCL8|nr:MAG: type I restriction endonuclease subunit M [candidate division LCP-89 bacterium B3_LCP]